MKSRGRVRVQLSGRDEGKISELLSNKGIRAVRVLRRALVLQQLNEARGTTQVALKVNLARKTVRAIAYRYQEGGLERAL
jgi:hypothetical protein